MNLDILKTLRYFFYPECYYFKNGMLSNLVAYKK